MTTDNLQKRILAVGFLSATTLFAVLLWSTTKPPSVSSYIEKNKILLPLRNEPERFPIGTHMPDRPEGLTSGSIDMSTFSAGRDLVYIDDPRVWWESDNDTNDDEDDHTINKALELPLRRLIEMVCENGGTLEVQDAYRPTYGVHAKRSLHREGRAVDVTCDEFSLEKLAKLCWAAGFDWVYHEKGTGPHVHCSVRRLPNQTSTLLDDKTSQTRHMTEMQMRKSDSKKKD